VVCIVAQSQLQRPNSSGSLLSRAMDQGSVIQNDSLIDAQFGSPPEILKRLGVPFLSGVEGASAKQSRAQTRIEPQGAVIIA
jgi:hypothetical protein